MGYFSNLAIDLMPNYSDCGDISPKKQLLWRLEELEDRLEELAGAPYIHERCAFFSDNDLRYILPRHLISAAEVDAAIELAIRDLADWYGVYIREKPEAPEMDEITGMQISFLDILSIKALGGVPFEG